MDDGQMLQQAREAVQEGEKALALQLASKAVMMNPRNKQAWLMVAEMVDDPDKKRECLAQVLALDPDDQDALQRIMLLHQVEEDAFEEPEPYPADLREALLVPQEEPSPGTTAESAAEPPDATPDSGEETRTCPVCGADIRAGAKFCNQCGWEVPVEAPAAEKAQRAYRILIFAGLIILLLPVLCVVLLLFLNSMGIRPLV